MGAAAPGCGDGALDPPPRADTPEPHDQNPADGEGRGKHSFDCRCGGDDDNALHHRVLQREAEDKAGVCREAGASGAAADGRRICQTSRRAGKAESEETVAGQGRRLPPPPRGLALTRGAFCRAAILLTGVGGHMWPPALVCRFPVPRAGRRAGGREAGGSEGGYAEAREE